MFDLKEAKIEAPSKVQEFIDLYEKFSKGLTWLNAQALNGKDVYKDKLDFYRLTTAMDLAWGKLSDQERRDACMQLIDAGYMPQTLADVIKRFNGKVVKVH